MSRLVYCILRANESWPDELPAGIGGAAVSAVTDGELAAAVSRVANFGGAPGAADVTAYADVVAALAVDHTVLPVRYGCLFPSAAGVREFLSKRRAEFAVLLDKLDGCVEMGVRVLVNGLDRPAGEQRNRPARPGGGAAYLTVRRAAYAWQDSGREAGAVAAGAVRRALESLSVQSRIVFRREGENLLVSLYFLVRREHIAAVCSRFRRLQGRGRYRLLLSGPWAPYNFVAPGGAP